jgi:hypothetical protein
MGHLTPSQVAYKWVSALHAAHAEGVIGAGIPVISLGLCRYCLLSAKRDRGGRCVVCGAP